MQLACIETIPTKYQPLGEGSHDLFSFIVLNVFGFFLVDFTDIHISLSHTVHNREIWDICKGNVG